MLGTDMHRVVTPTIWGYATLIRVPDGAEHHGATWRIDTVLPPDLTPEQLDDFHAELLRYLGRRRRAAASRAGRAARRALRQAIDVQTTAALGLRSVGRQTSLEVSTAFVSAMRSVVDSAMAPEQEALARQVVWCGLGAARQGEAQQLLDAAGCLRRLAAVGSTGETAAG